jgi:hypothetical protein
LFPFGRWISTTSVIGSECRGDIVEPTAPLAVDGKPQPRARTSLSGHSPYRPGAALVRGTVVCEDGVLAGAEGTAFFPRHLFGAAAGGLVE